MNSGTDRRLFGIVVLGALAVRLLFVLAIRPLPVSDFAWYYAQASGIAHGLGYTLHGLPTALWPPGWPYFLAAIIALFGPSTLPAEIVQAVLNALTAGIAFLIGRALFGRSIGLAAGIGYAVLPSAVEWCATLASEPLYTLLCALGTYIWVTRRPREFGWFALSGILFGAAALVRPSALAYWIVPLLYALIVREERSRLGAWVAATAVGAACMLLVISPMTVRNYRAFGTFVLISNNGGVSLYEGNNPTSSGTDSILTDPHIAKILSNPRTETAADRLASQLAVQYMLTHPRQDALFALRRLKSLYATDDSVIRFTLESRHFQDRRFPPPGDTLAVSLALVNNSVYTAIMALAALGLAVCFLRLRRGVYDPRWGILLGLILYNTAVFMVFTSVERYHYPIMPYFCVFSGVGVVVGWSYLRDRLRGKQHLDREIAAALND